MKKVAIKKWLIPAICAVAVVAVAVVAVFLLQPKGGVAIVKKWKPQRASSNVEPYARRAIEIIDSYLGFKISADEAKAAFKEVSTRMEDLDITFDDKRYTVADDIIDSRILYLYFDAEEMTDSEFWEYRDVLAFQIGEDVSGRKYPAKHDHYNLGDFENRIDKDQELFARLDEYAGAVAEYDCHALEDFLSVSITLDQMNGVKVNDVYAIVDHVLEEFEEGADYEGFSLAVRYQKYDQEVFTVSFLKNQYLQSFMIAPSIDFHTYDAEDIENGKMERETFQTEDIQELKEELEKMAKAFDT